MSRKPGIKQPRKSTAKPPASPKPEVMEALAVQGIVLSEPQRIRPTSRGPIPAYRPEYCDMLLDYYREQLEKSGRKLIETSTEEVRSKSNEDSNTAAEDENGKLRETDGTFTKKPEPKEGEDSQPSMTPEPGRKLTRKERREIRRAEYRHVTAELPSLAVFAGMIGVSTPTLTHWQHQYPSFKEAVLMAKDMGANALIQRGLAGQYRPEMVAFVGQHWYGMVPRTEITGAEGAPLNPPPELRMVSMETLNEHEKALLELRSKLLLTAGSGGK